ncbi:MAG: hypothetical protein HYY00_02515 [Chloroflexi bacterium]|nr:hypothetical protein [Chloroflexota bacterium]
MQQGIVKGDVLQRLAGLSFIAGAILLIVFNAIFPRASDPADVGQLVQKIADTRGGFWEVDHLLLAVGIWAFMIGATGVYRSISTGGAAVWARLGFYGVIVGTTLFTVLFALEGFGLPQVVELWEKAAGADKAALFQVASSLAWMNAGLFSMTIIVYWLALLFLGVGMALSTVYPKWLGWGIIVLAAAIIIVVGLPQAFAGPSQLVTNTLFPILSILATVWGLALGVWTIRKAW